MKRNRYFVAAAILAGVFGILGGLMVYSTAKRLIPFYAQLTRDRIGTAASRQPPAQKDSRFVGSDKCVECHQEEYDAWKESFHAKMIQSPGDGPEVIVGDFSSLPADASFSRGDVAYTIGGKFKQRYMLRLDRDGVEDYVIGNYQWNTQLKRWQPYHPYKDWYSDGFAHDNRKVPTSKTCDGCHFVGFMSSGERVEPGISCESCHGPGEAHLKDPEGDNIYSAGNDGPYRAAEVCLQCHMRNRDLRLATVGIEELFGDVRDYPWGFEPGRPLMDYKLQAPFELGTATKEFYGDGVGKKNRMQGNEYIHSAMYRHGVTCFNCHDSHKLDATTTHSTGDAVCMKCHTFGSLIGPHQKTLELHTRHKPGSTGSSCIECHMPKTGRHLKSSPLTVRTHVFGFIAPDRTRRYGVPNGCTSCHEHEKESLEWAEEEMRKFGMTGWR